MKDTMIEITKTTKIIIGVAVIVKIAMLIIHTARLNIIGVIKGVVV